MSPSLRLLICSVTVLWPLSLEMVKRPLTDGAYKVLLPPPSIAATYSSPFPGACRTHCRQ